MTLTWRRCQGAADWVSLTGNQMHHAGWQDCMRLAHPRQVRHAVQWTDLAPDPRSTGVWASRETEKGLEARMRYTIYHPVSRCCFPSLILRAC